MKPYVGRIVYGWLYGKGMIDFDEMTNVSKDLRGRLSENYSVGRPEVVKDLCSCDGTRKWLFRLACGSTVETVYIPEEDRGTLCVSSQVGCTLNCSFCHTGTQRLKRNLTAAEIVVQVMAARDMLGCWERRDGRFLTNIVLMGMGEPLYNVKHVFGAVKLMTDGTGLGFSKRKVTLSTSGVVPMIGEVGRELDVKLAVSLHSARNEVRNELVPLNKKYPVEELIEACRNYPGLSNAKRITWEYVMIKGVNDSEEDAHALVRVIRGIPSKINLIPYNSWSGSAYERSDEAAIDRFAKILLRAGYASPVRRPRGEDIMAACGQLNSDVSQQVVMSA
jgi:23S rRNA (adenine2503-C2)-methyltransferase